MFNDPSSVDIAIFWRDLCQTFERSRNKKVPTRQQLEGDIPKLVVMMWTSLIKASLYSISFSSPPWIQLAFPYILELQNNIQHTLNPGCMALSVARAFLTCVAINGPCDSSRFTSLPAQLAPLAAWLKAPEQSTWSESIHSLLMNGFDPVYLQAGLMIAVWGCYQLQEGQSRLCCCSVPADHADYTSFRDITEYSCAGEHVVRDFLSALFVYQVSLPSMELMILQGGAAFAAAERKVAALEEAAEAVEAALAAASAALAAAEARVKEKHAGSSHRMECGTAELLGTPAGERGPADVQVRGVHRAQRQPALPGSGLAGAAPTPPAEGAGGSQGDVARVAGEGGGSGDGGGGAGGEGGRAAGGGGEGSSAAGTQAASQAAAEGKGGPKTTAAAGEGAGSGEEAAQGRGGDAATLEGAAAVGGVTGRRSDATAQALTPSSADIPSTSSSQHEAVGELSAGVLWLAFADHAEIWSEPLAEYHAEKPVGYENVHYMVLKVLVELLLLQTGATGGPSFDTAPQVKFLDLVHDALRCSALCMHSWHVISRCTHFVVFKEKAVPG